MTERFQAPFQRFFTTDLKTLPSAKLYFYENGTTTPKTVYRDPFKITPHDNPVIAGTHGMPADTFPPIYIDGTYTVELQNSLGVVQGGWPQDNVGGEQVEGAFDSYSAITSYPTGEIVTGSNGLFYVSQQNGNLNNDPTISGNRPTWWVELKLSPNYNAASTYASGEWVIYSGNWYKCKAAATGQTPSANSAYWDAEYVVFQWNSTTTFASGASAFVGVNEYISQQGTNLNHNPVGDTTYTWWKPLSRVSLEANPQLIKINPVSGGGTLLAEWNNVITDGNAGYILPLANSVAANTAIIISKSDIARTLYPIITRSGSDTIAWLGGTDTSFQIDTQFADSMILYSNGTNQWSF